MDIVPLIHRFSKGSIIGFMRYFIFFLLLLTTVTFDVFDVHAQNKSPKKTRKQLELEKKRNVEKIEQAKKILEETASQKKKTVSQLNAIQAQIDTKSEQINLINDDIELIDVELGEIESTSHKLEADIEKLKKQYGEALYKASKKSAQINHLGFLFAATSFRQLVMRFKYLQQYSDNRKMNIRQIQKVRVMLAEQQEAIRNKKLNKQQIASLREIETKNLLQIQNQRSEVIKELSEKEIEMRNELAERQKSISKLEGAIANLVNREVRKKNKAREAKVDVKTKGQKKPVLAALDDEDIKLANSFEASKRQLPWPTKSGFVSERFGVHPHPVLPGVKIKNDGINIQTQQNAVVRTVYDGIVVDIANIQGNGRVVAIQHGNFYTVYTKLKDTFVSVNQKVRSRETIGTAATINGMTEINFQIWKNTTKQNPEAWLGGK